jgi:hypothetical protein
MECSLLQEKEERNMDDANYAINFVEGKTSTVVIKICENTMKINSSFLFQHPVNVHNYTKNP